jgi:DNA helicase-2/ATP-dependent DNA helicase PcrA
MSKEELLSDILEKPKPLSKEQRDALLSSSRHVRIVAGAGTGKTETLTRKIACLVLYGETDPTKIVAFTFTEKAAQSMKSRIYERVRQLRGEEACARLGEMFMGTIHGFCLRILEDHFDYGDHNVLNENQEMAFIMREGWGLGLGKNGNYAQNCRDFIRSVNVVYDELISAT